LHSTSRI